MSNTVVTKQVWTCDRCAATVERPHDEDAMDNDRNPPGWARVTMRYTKQRTSKRGDLIFDAFDYCVECTSLVRTALGAKTYNLEIEEAGR